MKLIIQIPCWNEEAHLPQAVAELPRELPGIDVIEYLIIDDGSTDRTSEVAKEAGVHHVIRFPRNRGLAAGFMAGLDASLRLEADIIVNTDADNQYCADDIGKLIRPILEGRADMVVGDRQTDRIAHFSPMKKLLQKFGSAMVRGASGTDVADATSGFRAFDRECAMRLFVHNRFSYTLESLIQAGRSGMSICNVAVRTNPMARPSRLAKSSLDYVRKNGPVILRSYAMYRPVQVFAALSSFFFLVGSAAIIRFLVFYFADPARGGHNQSLTLGVGAIILAFIAALMALVGDLLATNRRLFERSMVRLRRLEQKLGSDFPVGPSLGGKLPERIPPISAIPVEAGGRLRAGGDDP